MDPGANSGNNIRSWVFLDGGLTAHNQPIPNLYRRGFWIAMAHTIFQSLGTLFTAGKLQQNGATYESLTALLCVIVTAPRCLKVSKTVTMITKTLHITENLQT